MINKPTGDSSASGAKGKIRAIIESPKTDPTKGPVPLTKKRDLMDFMSDSELTPNKVSGTRSF